MKSLPYFICDSSYFFTKPCLSLKQIYGYKRVEGIASFNFFSSSNFTPLHNGLIIMVSVYNDMSKFFSTYKVPVYTLEEVISNQTELEAGGKGD